VDNLRSEAGGVLWSEQCLIEQDQGGGSCYQGGFLAKESRSVVQLHK